MRAVLLAIALAITLPSCGPRPRPRWACDAAPRLYPSQHGPIPVCPGFCRASTASSSIVAMSGVARPSTTMLALFDRFFTKPIDLETLLDELGAAIERRRARRG